VGLGWSTCAAAAAAAAAFRAAWTAAEGDDLTAEAQEEYHGPAADPVCLQSGYTARKGLRPVTANALRCDISPSLELKKCILITNFNYMLHTIVYGIRMM
jgi:hypothetical protein